MREREPLNLSEPVSDEFMDGREDGERDARNGGRKSDNANRSADYRAGYDHGYATYQGTVAAIDDPRYLDQELRLAMTDRD